ncbi:hypothetical protein [Idiomarina piscisalsi]|uniref:Uncharacterized protein n=1 Tax=Idiomarina piscisalsi TaxID=1096243 RepID=A0A432YXC7_9GAMM|nr:hypothetical protein [Idiomarina piscisalsi]RUO67980.1 hypothetical protein CWI73_03750 [Idiomarina piscisalsi]
MEQLIEYATVMLTIVGAFSTLTVTLLPIAKATETKKDDKILGKINSALQFVLELANKLGLNPRKANASNEKSKA